MDEAAWLIQKRAQTRSAYSHARLPIKIEAFFSFSFFLFLPKRRPVNAPHSFPVSSHQVRALDFHFAPLYPFADTILFLSSNFGHIRSTRPCFCHHRASKTRQREGDGIDQGRWNNRVSSSSSRERKTISPYRVSPYFPLGLEVGRLPLCPSSRFFRFKQAAWRATAVRLRRRGYAYPGGIAENGLIIMAGVVTPACFRRRGGVCTRDTTPKYIHAPRHPVRKIFSVSNPPSPRTRILEQTEQTTP